MKRKKMIQLLVFLVTISFVPIQSTCSINLSDKTPCNGTYKYCYGNYTSELEICNCLGNYGNCMRVIGCSNNDQQYFLLDCKESGCSDSVCSQQFVPSNSNSNSNVNTNMYSYVLILNLSLCLNFFPLVTFSC